MEYKENREYGQSPKPNGQIYGFYALAVLNGVSPEKAGQLENILGESKKELSAQERRPLKFSSCCA